MEGKGSLDEELLDEVYAWIDEIQLSRPKKNISRDFSDALMAAEVIKTYISKLVSLHNYPSAHNVKQKTTNWATLNSTHIIIKERFFPGWECNYQPMK